MKTEWEDWLAGADDQQGPLLDLGCGPGSFISTSPPQFEKIGIDVSMEWLVVAQRICASAGVKAEFAAALAESLPLRSGTIGLLTALDVIEHVSDQGAMVREIDRVLRPGGMFYGATPNRYSVGAEPHVGVWGVGWLPRAFQAPFVHWRVGLPYAFNRLLSHREIAGLFRSNATFVPSITPAPIPKVDQERFGRRRRMLARTYNWLLGRGPFLVMARNFGAFFRLSGRKPPVMP